MHSSVVETLVQAAWRRRLVVITTEQLALALIIVFSGLILMLLMGTQILEWYWLLPLSIVGLGISGWRIRERLLRHYEVARLVDRRLQLNDALSTAWFLLTNTSPGNGDASKPAAQYQLRQAEQIAANIAAESAFPMVWSRMWIITLSLLVVIVGLFAARYLVNSSLSLKPALIRLPLPSSRSTLAAKESPGSRNDHAKPEAAENGELAREIVPPQARDGQPNSSVQTSPLQNGQTDPRSDQKANSAANGKSSQPSRSADGQQSASGSQSQDANQSDANSPSGDSKPSPNSKEANKSKGDERRGQSKTADGQQTPGLMDKMRDALSGLMAKLQHSPANDSASRDAKSSNSPGAQKGQNQDNAGNKQGAPPDQNGQKAESSLDSQSSAQAAAVEKTPASSLGSSNQQTPQSKSNDPQSGAGRQDGEKDVRQAEQLKAMGKLAEIIGKRSANLTGEIKVEKPSGEQQLQTQYSNQVGHHSDTGGEINRDQVPLEYQSYVRAYMKEVHKQAAAKAP